MVPQEEAEQMKQVGDPVVYRRRGDQQDARTHQDLRERAVAVGVGVSEAMGLVDDEKPARGGRGRQGSATSHAERLMGDDRGVSLVALQQTTPLVYQHRRHDQRERLAEREGDRERDVRLTEADGVREQGTPVARQDALLADAVGLGKSYVALAV